MSFYAALALLVLLPAENAYCSQVSASEAKSNLQQLNEILGQLDNSTDSSYFCRGSDQLSHSIFALAVFPPSCSTENSALHLAYSIDQEVRDDCWKLSRELLAASQDPLLCQGGNGQESPSPKIRALFELSYQARERALQLDKSSLFSNPNYLPKEECKEAAEFVTVLRRRILTIATKRFGKSDSYLDSFCDVKALSKVEKKEIMKVLNSANDGLP